MEKQTMQEHALEYLRQEIPGLPDACSFHQAVASGAVLLYLLNRLRFPDEHLKIRFTLDDGGFVVVKQRHCKQRQAASKEEFLAQFTQDHSATLPLFVVNQSPFTFAFCENLSQFFAYCELIDMPKELIPRPFEVIDGSALALGNLAILLKILHADFTQQVQLREITPNCSAQPAEELQTYSRQFCCFHIEAGVVCKSAEVESRLMSLLFGSSEERSIRFFQDYFNIELSLTDGAQQETLFCVVDYSAPDSLRFVQKQLGRVACSRYKNAVFIGVNARNKAPGMELEALQNCVFRYAQAFAQAVLHNVDLETGVGVVKLLSSLERLARRE